MVREVLKNYHSRLLSQLSADLLAYVSKRSVWMLHVSHDVIVRGLQHLTVLTICYTKH